MRRLCGRCDISYPSESSYTNCPVCDSVTTHISGEADPDHEVKSELGIIRRLSPEARKALLWRRKRLVALGYYGAMLDLLADSGVDLHDISDLITGGCTPDLAARIVL
jgi:hypothetical protein